MKKQVKWDMYIELVDFIAECFGENVEVVLHDLSDMEHSVVAIRNGHITGRTVGAPLTVFALSKIKESIHTQQNRIMNYRGTAQSGNPIRSSSFFIKNEKGELAGMLCVNIDVSEYKRAEEIIKKLSFLPQMENAERESYELLENFPSTMSEMVANTIKEVMNGKPVQIERLTANEKINIVEELHQKGIFQLKGAVSEVAVELMVSEATIYRYLKNCR
jgi:Uncharacterized protein conserved in bacteria